MSSASESACSRDGEGDTELDLDVNILPRRGYPRRGLLLLSHFSRVRLCVTP